ncbi:MULTISPECIES: hypothetical protein [Deinococcus]|jgi:hypothetical protein|uniref:Tetratricopeptide repeat protein n=2 Tax=Deinococcus TaxID=1298 RepID=A0A221SSY6_9DEIO|nr:MULTISPECIES: hypothetical protein [Deinococcus]ASN79758.1 hypothetical protein DFI_00940 [Deinococcus ficus]MDP9765581.1 hypothetical protein [Deinococcus enclensis]GHF77310.1 hypothetical protein GCM10017782_14270 [Deinococcus ficus]
MRPDYLHAARALQLGREHAVEGEANRALRLYDESLGILRTLPPERTRDILLAHTHLAYYQTLTLIGARDVDHHLSQGVSYARCTRDPLARAIAEECLSGLDAVL